MESQSLNIFDERLFVCFWYLRLTIWDPFMLLYLQFIPFCRIFIDPSTYWWTPNFFQYSFFGYSLNVLFLLDSGSHVAHGSLEFALPVILNFPNAATL